MEHKFTKGTWYGGCFEHSKEGEGCQCTDITADGYCGSIATVHVWNGIEGIENGDNDSPKRDEAIANSKLISAAPDLLEALEGLMEWVGELTGEDIDKIGKLSPLKLYSKAEQAIKKALE